MAADHCDDNKIALKNCDIYKLLLLLSSSRRPPKSPPSSAAMQRDRSTYTNRLTIIVVGVALVLLLSLSLLLNGVNCIVRMANRHMAASISGDLALGILIPVHERPTAQQAQSRTCGSVREQYGIQRVEAAIRTIDSINADPNILNNITLGVEIRDSCWFSTIALEQSIEFIRDAMAASEQSLAKSFMMEQQNLKQQQQQKATSSQFNNYFNTSIGNSLSPAAGSSSQPPSVCTPYLRQAQSASQSQAALAQLASRGGRPVRNVVGVIGPASSGDTIQVQHLLQLFSMPQVGYSATSRDLSNKNMYKYFLRVVPSDALQAQVMIDLMRAHNWTYVTVVYTEGSYGTSLMKAFRERAQEVGICFATLESMHPNADEAKFDDLIAAVRKHPRARVIVCMCEGRTVGMLFEAFKRHKVPDRYLVVGGDGWSDRFDVVEGKEHIAQGGISIRIHSAYVEDFDRHYFALSPFNNSRNPWFSEFWEQKFQCNLEPPTQLASRAPSAASGTVKLYNRTCTGRESLRSTHKQDSKLAFVQKSIITMALGLDKMQKAICGPQKSGLCAEMLPVNGSILLQHLMNVSFSFLGDQVYFDQFGDPPGTYEILNFRRRRRRPKAPHRTRPRPPQKNPSHAFPDPTKPSKHQNQSTKEHDKENNEEDQEEEELLPSGDTNDANENDNYFSTMAAAADSYSTLRVNSEASNLSKHDLQQQQLPKGLSGQQQLRLRAAQQQHLRSQTQASSSLHLNGNSNVDGNSIERAGADVVREQQGEFEFEYAHVGSWSSQDKLTLFAPIEWPSSNLERNDENEQDDEDDADGRSDRSRDYSGHAPFASDQAGELGQHRAQAMPVSVCSVPCAKGFAKRTQSDNDKCCWVCVACRPNEILESEYKCAACRRGWWPNADKTKCEQIPIQYLEWRSFGPMSAMSTSLIGLCLTLATACVFIKHNKTPVVKASTRELSYMILFAMLLCYLTTFFLVARPSKFTCLATRILPGFSFAMMYGALVTKTNRIARILAGSKKKIITSRPRFMSATAQMCITWCIVALECFIIAFMLAHEPADEMHDYSSGERVLLVCNTTTMAILVPLGFDFFLIAMCTLYAIKTRNVPENFNEAKFIGFTMYTTLVIWVAFVAIYLSNSEHKVTLLSLCISFSALFALFLLFFPKCYIIIFKPEKNNRSFFTTTKNVRCHIGFTTTSAAAAAAAATATATSTISHHHQQQHFLQQASSSETAPACEQQNHVAGSQRRSGSSEALKSVSEQADQLRRQCEAPLSSIQGASEPAPHDQATLRTKPSEAGDNELQVGTRSSLIRRQAGMGKNTDSGQWAHSSTNCSFVRAPISETGASEPNQAGDANASILDQIQWFLRGSTIQKSSTRKGSARATSIQQHLMAVRYAENLDRQTHDAKRSRVQRQLHRFEPQSSVGDFGRAPCGPTLTRNQTSFVSDNLLARTRPQLDGAEGPASGQLERLQASLVESLAGRGDLELGDSQVALAQLLHKLLGPQNVQNLVALLNSNSSSIDNNNMSSSGREPPTQEADHRIQVKPALDFLRDAIDKSLGELDKQRPNMGPQNWCHGEVQDEEEDPIKRTLDSILGARPQRRVAPGLERLAMINGNESPQMELQCRARCKVVTTPSRARKVSPLEPAVMRDSSELALPPALSKPNGGARTGEASDELAHHSPLANPQPARIIRLATSGSKKDVSSSGVVAAAAGAAAAGRVDPISKPSSRRTTETRSDHDCENDNNKPRVDCNNAAGAADREHVSGGANERAKKQLPADPSEPKKGESRLGSQQQIQSGKRGCCCEKCCCCELTAHDLPLCTRATCRNQHQAHQHRHKIPQRRERDPSKDRHRREQQQQLANNNTNAIRESQNQKQPEIENEAQGEVEADCETSKI